MLVEVHAAWYPVAHNLIDTADTWYPVLHLAQIQGLGHDTDNALDGSTELAAMVTEALEEPYLSTTGPVVSLALRATVPAVTHPYRTA